MHIRYAVISDIWVIAEVHVRSWQHAYRGLLTNNFLKELSVEQRQAMWARALVSQSPSLLVAEQNGQVVGFSAFGPDREESADPSCYELWALYLRPDYFSQGVGKQLWLESRGAMIVQGAKVIRLRVLEGNTRAIDFYTKAGFRMEVGSLRPVTLPGQHVNEAHFALHIPGRFSINTP